MRAYMPCALINDNGDNAAKLQINYDYGVLLLLPLCAYVFTGATKLLPMYGVLLD